LRRGRRCKDSKPQKGRNVISNFAILAGVLAALVAGGAQAIAHRYAQRQRWHPIARYTCGVTVIGAAFAVHFALTFPYAVALGLATGGSLLYEFKLDANPNTATRWPDLAKRELGIVLALGVVRLFHLL